MPTHHTALAKQRSVHSTLRYIPKSKLTEGVKAMPLMSEGSSGCPSPPPSSDGGVGWHMRMSLAFHRRASIRCTCKQI